MIPKLKLLTLLFTLMFSFALTNPVTAEESEEPAADEAKTSEKDSETDKEDKDSKEGKDDKEKEEKKKTLEKVVEEFEKIDGLFTLYRNPENGELMMELTPDLLNREFIYFSYSENGVVAAGHFRGAYRDQAIIKLKKYYDRIELEEQNTAFYFDPENPLARSAEANISPAVLASTKITATSEDGERFLIKLDDLLLNESLHKLKRNPNPKKKPHEQFSLGKLSKDKTKYADVRVYPENMNILVDYVFENASPYVRGGSEVTDPRAVTVKLQHSFMPVPENDYQPRLDDARVGYFLDQVTDLTNHSITPYRDLINRWHLVKKNPDAEMSEPVEPIVWWIENTTPYEYRDAIREGVLAWNLAFEQAGFKNAIVVKQQPDDADWDAGDIRYNVLRWTSSPNPPFGGYGPSFTNPKTGQIIGADIMLEDVYVSNRVRMEQLFSANEVSEVLPIDEGIPMKMSVCHAAANMQTDLAFARSALTALGDTGRMAELVESSLYELALHEVGHTLGLNHNMKSSQLRSNDEIHNADITQGVILGSVMDYGAVNLAPPGQEQGDFYTVKPGPYDVWAIQFGYDPDVSGEARVAHLARSSEPQLAFGNDADDMRSPGRAIDPRVNISDMTSDSIGYAEDRMALVNSMMGQLKDKLTVEGETWAEIRNAFLVLSSQQQRQARVVSRFVGGVYVDRALAGEAEQGSVPYSPVEIEKQQRAMAVLRENVFGPEAFQIPDELISHLAVQRRGFGLFGSTEDPKIHARILRVQKDVLDHLMHPVVLARITDTALYGNQYSLDAMLSDLTDAVFADDLKASTSSYRQNLQVEYAQRLLGMLKAKGDKSYHYPAKAAALAEVERIEAWMSKYSKGRVDNATKQSRKYILHLIEQALDRNA